MFQNQTTLNKSDRTFVMAHVSLSCPVNARGNGGRLACMLLPLPTTEPSEASELNWGTVGLEPVFFCWKATLVAVGGVGGVLRGGDSVSATGRS